MLDSKKILLVDVDSSLPNLVLMKLSTYHKALGDEIELLKIGYSGLPGERKKVLIDNDKYKQVYVSIIFTPNKEVIEMKNKDNPNYQFGGTGYDLTIKLPKEIDDVEEDWSIYPDAEFYCNMITRGCIRSCLSGDTLINTINGDIPIKNLIGKDSVQVYTYDPKTKDFFITNGLNIVSNGIKELVRVNFDDGTWIDCTPDHRFLTFLNGNQSVSTREIIKEAKDLKFHESVRAFKIYKDKSHGNRIMWGRNKGKRNSQLVMEYYINRKLRDKEVVHHLDGDYYNDKIENLKLCKDGTEHWTYHRKQVSDRMKKDNPSKYCTKESYKIMVKKITGLKRSLDQRINIRNAKLGIKNPNYKEGKHTGITRIKEIKGKQINHKVVSVSKIGFGETYDMEVPSTGWFFANKVLVHNCPFCYVSRKEGMISSYRSTDYIFGQMKKWGFKKAKLLDNNILSHPDCNKILQDIIDSRIIMQFNQGMDVRLLDEEKSKLISQIRYIGEHFFAFDMIAYKKMIQDKMHVYRKHNPKPWKSRFYIYINPADKIEDIIYRIEWCRRNKALAYVMRDKECWNSPNKDLIRDLMTYCQAVPLYKKLTFVEFIKIARLNMARKIKHGKIYADALNKIELELQVAIKEIEDKLKNEQVNTRPEIKWIEPKIK